MNTAPAVTPIDLQQQLDAFPPPALVDVRRQPAFDADPFVIPGAIKRDADAVSDWWRTSNRGVRSSCIACVVTKFRKTPALALTGWGCPPAIWTAVSRRGALRAAPSRTMRRRRDG